LAVTAAIHKHQKKKAVPRHINASPIQEEVTERKEEGGKAREFVTIGVISHHEALELLCLREGLGGRGGRKGLYYHEGVSLDLGRTETMVVVVEEGIAVPTYQEKNHLYYHHHNPRGGGGRQPALVASWEELEDIVAQAHRGEPGCFALYADGTQPWRISAISLQTGRAANLLPSLFVKGPPTVVLGSFLMHRLEGPRPGTFIGPAEDTRRKLDAIKMKKVYGRVLDTTTGLGYTAIAAARCAHVSEVVTIEADQASLEMSRYNPWSSDLYSSSSSSLSSSYSSSISSSRRGVGENEEDDDEDEDGIAPIRLVQGDVCQLIHSFRDGHFAAVMHDPPAMALSRATFNLYSPAFYSQLYRVLRWRGRLFHFVGGHPKAKESGRLYKTVVQRLEAAGFKRVMIQASAQGVVAEKGEDRKSKKILHARGGGGGGEGGKEGGKAQRLRAEMEVILGLEHMVAAEKAAQEEGGNVEDYGQGG